MIDDLGDLPRLLKQGFRLIAVENREGPLGGAMLYYDFGPDVLKLIERHDHYRAEFHHHSGGEGSDCDCVELADKFARGEIE